MEEDFKTRIRYILCFSDVLVRHHLSELPSLAQHHSQY